MIDKKTIIKKAAREKIEVSVNEQGDLHFLSLQKDAQAFSFSQSLTETACIRGFFRRCEAVSHRIRAKCSRLGGKFENSGRSFRKTSAYRDRVSFRKRVISSRSIKYPFS